MLKNEAIWLGKQLKTRHFRLSTVVNLGSESDYFRRIKQPWIKKYVFDPLISGGVKVVHIDKRNEKGIDYVLDIESSNFFRLLKQKVDNPQTFILTNLLEHLKNPTNFARKISAFTSKNGYLIVSCPYKYPYHPDPIDNNLRLTPSEVAMLFPQTKIIEQKIIKGDTFKERLWGNKIYLVYYLLRLFCPFYKYQKWISHISHLSWLNKRFTVSCVILQKK